MCMSTCVCVWEERGCNGKGGGLTPDLFTHQLASDRPPESSSSRRWKDSGGRRRGTEDRRRGQNRGGEKCTRQKAELPNPSLTDILVAVKRCDRARAVPNETETTSAWSLLIERCLQNSFCKGIAFKVAEKFSVSLSLFFLAYFIFSENKRKLVFFNCGNQLCVGQKKVWTLHSVLLFVSKMTMSIEKRRK